ncbi:MAG: LLM class oxidoreductase [Planktomarina sp.]
MTQFPKMNRAYNTTFRPGKLSIGLVAPLEQVYPYENPTLNRHIERMQLAERLGFSALWLRDIPFSVPSFGDVGQMLDPFVYLGALAVQTQTIGLGIASAILPLRHPAHVAKSTASVDMLSGGRMLLGVASGDRPEEYPAMNMDYETRADRFRDSIAYMRKCFETDPQFEGMHGTLNGKMDMLPKPNAGTIPMLITGGSGQTPEWGAEHGNGWITYPRNAAMQGKFISEYRGRMADAGQPNKPVMQSLYVDLMPKASMPPRPIHLGFATGTDYLIEYLKEVEALGVNHVAINLRLNNVDIEETLERLGTEVLPQFA